MATVNITKEFKERVEARVKHMHHKELESELPHLNKPQQLDAHYLYHFGCWGKEHMHLVHEIPKDWLGKIEDTQIVITGETEEGINTQCTIRFTGVNGYKRPRDSYYSRSESEIKYEDLVALPDAVVGKAEAMKAWEENKQVVVLNTKWKKVSLDILEFLNKCKTLNEAVRLFPTVRLYIHRDDLERLDRKIERFTERKKIVEEMATDELTAAAIAARLAGVL